MKRSLWITLAVVLGLLAINSYVGGSRGAEPHASVNQHLTRVVFTSNWGRGGTEEVEMYLLELPVDWTERLC